MKQEIQVQDPWENSRDRLTNETPFFLTQKCLAVSGEPLINVMIVARGRGRSRSLRFNFEVRCTAKPPPPTGINARFLPLSRTADKRSLVHGRCNGKGRSLLFSHTMIRLSTSRPYSKLQKVMMRNYKNKEFVLTYIFCLSPAPYLITHVLYCKV